MGMSEEDKIALTDRIEEDGPNDPFWLMRGWEFACEHKNAEIARLKAEHEREMRAAIERIGDILDGGRVFDGNWYVEKTAEAIRNEAREECNSILLVHQPKQEAEKKPRRPKIVCLCGSTRFYDEFQEANYAETMAGRIVLSVGFYPHAKAKSGHGEGIGHDSKEKVALDELHKRKIDLSDEVLVLNVGGYMGVSTQSEIAYAIEHGKPVRYLESPKKGGLPIEIVKEARS